MNIKTWRAYPTCLIGYIHGMTRYETIGEIDFYDVDFPSNGQFLFLKKPFSWGGRTFAVTHLQKRSRFGFLIFWPFLICFWFQWRFQKKDFNFNADWIPGTEVGTYPRLGARWQAKDGTYEFPSIYPPWNYHMD